MVHFRCKEGYRIFHEVYEVKMNVRYGRVSGEVRSEDVYGVGEYKVEFTFEV